MGANLTPLVIREKIGLEGVAGKTLAIDTLNAVYQFLALIRDWKGELMRNRKGLVTSHLIGLATRYSKLALDNKCKFIFVFDGPPHPLKRREIEKRREIKTKALEEYRRLKEAGDYEKAFSKAIMAVSVDEWILESSRKLIELMGFPIVDALADAEAQAAFIVSRGEAWAVSSQDWDSLLYGSPRLVRYVTLTGFEWLPSKQVARKLEPELIEMEKNFAILNVSRKQLVEIAILSGTDFNDGVKGIGPRKAYKLIKTYGSLDRLPSNIREALPENYREIVELFLNPPIREDYNLKFRGPDEEKLYRFLVDENNFSQKRAELVVGRLRRAWERVKPSQRGLEEYFS